MRGAGDGGFEELVGKFREVEGQAVALADVVEDGAGGEGEGRVALEGFVEGDLGAIGGVSGGVVARVWPRSVRDFRTKRWRARRWSSGSRG